MSGSRLFHALETGAASLPEGRIAVFGPAAGEALPLSPDDVQIVTSFRPDHDYFAARGYDCRREPEGEFAAALVFPPRARDAARGQVARAAACVAGKPLFIEGARGDGIDTLMRDLRARVGLDGLSKAHGRLLWLTAPAADVLADWAKAALPREVGDWLIPPGGFSADGPDPGSKALLAALPPLSGRVADLGAGWGFLARGALAASPAVTEMHLVEADAEALDCARRNVPDPRARFHWSDATRELPGGRFDAVVTNPPFHRGRAADPELGRAFLASAAGALSPRGSLWLVANRQLPYESVLSARFAEVEPLPAVSGYKVIRASRPRR